MSDQVVSPPADLHIAATRSHAPAASHATATKRRIAFASYVDEIYLPGFLTLLRSLALTNPS